MQVHVCLYGGSQDNFVVHQRRGGGVVAQVRMHFED